MSSQAPGAAPRTPAAQPNTKKTKKDQKGFQLGQEYNAQEVNSEFDRLHKRVNDIVVEVVYATTATSLKTDGTPTNAQICTQINNLISDLAALAAIVKQAGLVKSS